MKNTSEHAISGFFSKNMQQEYAHAGRYFDITNRTIPAPWFPPKQDWLNESQLVRTLSDNANNRDLSIYIHIPFCNGKCRFCELYCFHLPASKYDIMERYVRCIVEEIKFWSRCSNWPGKVTTIHFGGGSPLILGLKHLTNILNAIHTHFNTTDQTEIAIEITSSQINNESPDFFKDLNIQRIHVGVQTLSDSIRPIIGRREPAEIVKEKIFTLTKQNLIVSADMLYGLPFQTQKDLEKDLNQLIKLSVDGFALYELNIPPALKQYLKKNHSWAMNKLLNYQTMLSGKHQLNAAGFSNVFFNHYGNQRDKNLYCTYPGRNEDCLSLGTIADSKVGTLCFRHQKLKQYMISTMNGKAGLDFGYLQDEKRGILNHFEAELMLTQIRPLSIEQMTRLFGHTFQGIFHLWQEARLLKKEKYGYRLTGTGCWLLSDMMAQIRRLRP